MGAFQGHLQGDVLSVLLDAGVLFLLRWSLDDTSDGVVAAAIQGFAAILIVPSDKELADKVFSFPRGQELSALCPVMETQDKKRSSEDEEEEKSLTDAEQLNQDTIKGLVQMSILPRLRYILEVCCPGAPTVQDVLDVLTRIAQHSTQSANEVLRCPRLMEAIFANFLPLSWNASKLKSGIVYGQPVAAAMRLARAVCCAGRHMAATLISKYNLTDRMMRYTALSPRSMQVELQEAYSIYTKSLRTWRVCILYGLSCDAVREMYSTLIEQLQSIQCLSILMATPEHQPEISCAAAMFGVMEATLHAAGATADQTDPEQRHKKDSLPPLGLNWSHVTGLLPLIGGCLTKWVKEILDCDPSPTLQGENLDLLSGAVAALTAYYSKSCNQILYSPVDTLQQLEQLTNSVLLPLVESQFLDWCFAQIRSNSAFNKSRESKLSRKFIPSLPDFGSLELIDKARTHPSESSITEPLGFTSSLMQLLFQVTKLHKGIAAKFLSILSKSAVLEYLNLVVESQDVPLSFFVRQEHHLQYFLLKLANNLIEVADSDEISSHVSLWHHTALSLFSKIFPGDEFYAFDLLSTIVLNPKYICKGDGPPSLGVTKELSEMSLVTPPLPSTCDTAAASRGELIAQAHQNLPYIRSTFMGSFQGLKYPLDTSRSLSLYQVSNIQSFLVPSVAGPLLPADWMFLPVVDLHNQAISVEMKGDGIDTLTDRAISIVTANLQLVLLLEEWRPLCLRHVSMASRIARLMCVFLTGSDLFLNSSVHDNLSALLRIYTSPSKLEQLDFNSLIPGVTSFYDLYASFLSQYSAVSFGDALFGCFVILPLAQRHDVKFRRAVWDEHIGVLRALSIPLGQLPIPLEEFLYPIEQNQALLALYLRALATQMVRLQWSPLFYLVAVHHLNAFIFQRVDPEDDHGLKRKITFLKQVLAVQNENVRHDVVYYYKPAPSNSLQPFEKFTNLPADRQLLLRSRDDFEESRRIYQTIAST